MLRLVLAFRGERIETLEILGGLDPEHLPDPPDYVFQGKVEVQNALVVGNGIIAREEGKGIDLSRSLWFGKICETPVFRRKKVPVFEGTSSAAYYLAGCGSANYFHWLLETLPRFHYVDPNQEKTLYVVPPLRKFHRETLAFLGVDRSNSRFIEVHDSEVWKIPHLVVPSPLNYCGMPSELLQEFWHEAMERNGVHDISRGERRIYLSRNDAGTRRVANEAELFTALRDLDFESVQCSKLSFSEQVKLFREASVIVGPHGAAMANLIFSNHGARFLELGTHAYTNPCFEYLCASVGLFYSKFHGEAEQSGDPSSDYVVDVDTLIAKLEDLI